jgi:hypothetical protein
MAGLVSDLGLESGGMERRSTAVLSFFSRSSTKFCMKWWSD